jgi:ABC-type transport system involved in multi-copper enzyme maturation permease subunit
VIAIVAAHQIQSLRRHRMFTASVTILTAIAVLAGVLGWASHQTIIGVYNEATKMLAQRGVQAPPNPFLLKPTLSLLSNMVIYITLMGALVAIVIGHLTMADDEANGIGRLLFSRQVSRRDYVLGKMAAAATVLSIGVLCGVIVSVANLAIVNRTFPSAGNLGRLVVFYCLCWLYLMIFALIGMITLLFARRRSLGLLSAIGVWMLVTFAIPQFTSGLRPAQSLNPIVDPISTSQGFFKITSHGRVMSIAEQFKQLSGRILETADRESVGQSITRLASLLGLLIVLGVAVVVLIQRHDFSGSGTNE